MTPTRHPQLQWRWGELVGYKHTDWWGGVDLIGPWEWVRREERLGRVWLQAGGRHSQMDSVKRRSHAGSCICRFEAGNFRAGDKHWDIFNLLMVLRLWEWMRPLGEQKNVEVWAWTLSCVEVEKRRQEQRRPRGTTDRVEGSQEVRCAKCCGTSKTRRECEHWVCLAILEGGMGREVMKV